MARILVLGDTHGHLDKMIEAMQAEQIDFALQVGDFGVYLPTGNLSALPPHRRTELGQFAEYFESQKSFPVPTYFCKGNHEDFDLLAKYENGDAIMPNIHYVPNGKVIDVQGVRIGFLGGNFSSRWFDQPVPKNCQSQKILGYLRKSEIDAIKADVGKIDILVTHEPSFAPLFTGDRKYGCIAIHELIEAGLDDGDLLLRHPAGFYGPKNHPNVFEFPSFPSRAARTTRGKNSQRVNQYSLVSSRWLWT